MFERETLVLLFRARRVVKQIYNRLQRVCEGPLENTFFLASSAKVARALSKFSGI